MYSFDDRLQRRDPPFAPKRRPVWARAAGSTPCCNDGASGRPHGAHVFVMSAPTWTLPPVSPDRRRGTLGFPGAEVDAELILLASALRRDLGLQMCAFELNSLTGQPDERKAHRAALIAYLEKHIDLLDEEARRRLHSNPLRILDTKIQQCSQW